MKKMRKADVVCYLLGMHGPMTRGQLTRGAWLLEGCKVPYKERSNNCYFSPTGMGNGGELSLLAKGLITRVPAPGRKYTYDLTPAGEEIAWRAAMALRG